MMVAEVNDKRGELLLNEPMSKHTSWRIGGPADRFYKPADIEDVSVFLSQLPENEKLFWLGLGSNLLVRDGGIRGTVICTTNVLGDIHVCEDGRVRVDAGVPCAKVARFCMRQGLQGAEFLAGIPGTMGGALAMNAGAFGSETWEWVSEVETIDHRGTRRKRKPGEFSITYRHVGMPEGEWFLGAWLELQQEDAGTEVLRQRIKALLEKRNQTQPTNQANAGSVFRNPGENYAARLIETAGLKGKCIGKACVSEKHANFIINTGGASADEVEQLINHVAAEVYAQHGVELRREVHIVGEQQR